MVNGPLSLNSLFFCVLQQFHRWNTDNKKAVALLLFVTAKHGAHATLV